MPSRSIPVFVSYPRTLSVFLVLRIRSLPCHDSLNPVQALGPCAPPSRFALILAFGTHCFTVLALHLRPLARPRPLCLTFPLVPVRHPCASSYAALYHCQCYLLPVHWLPGPLFIGKNGSKYHVLIGIRFKPVSNPSQRAEGRTVCNGVFSWSSGLSSYFATNQYIIALLSSISKYTRNC